MSEITLDALSVPADNIVRLPPNDTALAERAYCRAIEYLGHTVAPDIAEEAGRRARRLVLAGIPLCGAVSSSIRYAQARQHARRWQANQAAYQPAGN